MSEQHLLRNDNESGSFLWLVL